MLIGQTNSWLAEKNIQPDQAGAYSVVWSNASGSVTSAVGGVSVSVPPATLQSLMVHPGQLSFSFYGLREVHYVVEYKERLEDAAWIELEQRTGNAEIITVTDAMEASSNRFYRVCVE